MRDHLKAIGAMQNKPIGFDAAKDDWNAVFAGRPMTEKDWNQLTIGEQGRYAVIECKTKGAIYHSHISSDKIDFSISLPKVLALTNLDRDEAGKIERYMHKAVEKEIAAILQLRQMCGGKLP